MIKLFKRQSLDVLSDFVEACCLEEPSGTVSRSTVASLLEARSVEDAEARAGQIWTEMSSRRDMLGPRYPFTWEKNSISRPEPRVETLPYRFMLLLSCDGYVSGRSLSARAVVRASKAFELLTTHSLGGYLGVEAFNVGSPRGSELPRNLGDCIHILCIKSSEPRGDARPRPSEKDDGADVIAWISHEDHRPGQIFLVAGCSIDPDLIHKRGELSVEKWRRHINTLLPMFRAYAFPFVHMKDGILGHDSWNDLTSELEGMIMDRLRIALASSRRAMPESLTRSLESLGDEILQALPRTGS